MHSKIGKILMRVDVTFLEDPILRCSVIRKPIPGFPGYEAPIYGEIWSQKSGEWKRMKPNRPLRSGMICASLRVDGRLKSHSIGAFVLLTFVGPRPRGMDCCHWDDKKTNNRVDNLRWDTRKANVADSIRNGTFHFVPGTKQNPACSGARNAQSKLTFDDIPVIRTLFQKGESPLSIATRFNVCTRTITDAIHGKSWKHLKQQEPQCN